jgi:peptidoglycan-associated lipoprotein
MKANPTYLILIEGHTDERGTTAYNLVLGERRASAAMRHLIAQGVPASRITIVSYGEERPVCSDRYEACWARNRRAHFLVKRQ